jgi:hypothetical protein
VIDAPKALVTDDKRMIDAVGKDFIDGSIEFLDALAGWCPIRGTSGRRALAARSTHRDMIGAGLHASHRLRPGHRRRIGRSDALVYYRRPDAERLQQRA